MNTILAKTAVAVTPAIIDKGAGLIKARQLQRTQLKQARYDTIAALGPDAIKAAVDVVDKVAGLAKALGSQRVERDKIEAKLSVELARIVAADRTSMWSHEALMAQQASLRERAVLQAERVQTEAHLVRDGQLSGDQYLQLRFAEVTP